MYTNWYLSSHFYVLNCNLKVGNCQPLFEQHTRRDRADILSRRPSKYRARVA